MPASNHPGDGRPAANVQAKYATIAKKTPKMIASVLGLIAFAIRLATLLPQGRIYFIPSFSFLIAARPPTKGISCLESCVLAEEGRIPRSRPGRRAPLSGVRTRESRSAARELAIVSLAGLASFLFLNHQTLYLTGPFALSD